MADHVHIALATCDTFDNESFNEVHFSPVESPSQEDHFLCGFTQAFREGCLYLGLLLFGRDFRAADKEIERFLQEFAGGGFAEFCIAWRGLPA